MAETTLKTYRARTMAEALAEVKRDLGPEALIIRTRSFKVGGFFGMGARPVVEITASSGGDTVSFSPRGTRKALDRGGGRGEVPASTGSSSSKAEAARAVGTHGSEPYGPGAGHVGASLAAASGRAELAGATAAGSPVTESDLRSLKRMMGQVLRASRPAPDGPRDVGALPDALFEQYLRLVESEVAADIVEQVIGAVRDELPPAAREDQEQVREALLRHLARLVPDGAGPAGIPERGDGRPHTLALVGPTGVGKTTTLAKLAATHRLRNGHNVGLVTTDTYRIAAVEQLRTYADIIGVPLRVALTPGEMRDACASLSHCDVLLIDTAGRSHNDRERLAELAAFLDAASPHETHLLLPSTASESVLVEVADRFSAARPDRVIFTKLDEAVNYGVLLTVAHRLSLRLSYLTTGQEVPDHIEQSSPDRLAQLALDGAAAAGSTA